MKISLPPMNSKLLRISIVCLGLFSICSAADKITGEVVEDLFFYDSVQISGIEYPSDLDATTGTSSVGIEGMGSVTVGLRSGGGWPRLVVWGDSTVSSERMWDASAKKTWWAGDLVSPVHGRLVSAENLEFMVAGNHIDSQLIPLETYGMGMGNETFKFSPSATFVLPVNVPEFSKIWLGVKEGDTLQKIGEADFCVVQNQLCVIDMDSLNEVTLVREKFERCVVSEVSNGSVGKPPYCQLDCDRGFTFNDDMTGCVADDDEDAIEVFATDDIDIEGATVKRTGENGILAGPAPQGYLRYTGSNVQLDQIDTSGLSGEELREGLRRNASVGSRTTKPADRDSNAGDSVIADLTRTVNDLRGTLWAWENTILPEGQAQGEVRSAETGGNVVAQEGGNASHASAPLLPSTGPAGIFVAVAALGMGLMAFSRRRRH